MSNDEKTVQETKKSWFNTALFFGALAPAVFASTLNFAEGVTGSTSKLGRTTKNFLSNTWVAASISVLGTLGLLDVAKRAKVPFGDGEQETTPVVEKPVKTEVSPTAAAKPQLHRWQDTVSKSDSPQAEALKR